MRPCWLAVPALLILTGCDLVDPVVVYRQAAQQLRFTLERVEPSIQVAFPPDRSHLGLRLTLGVDNPTSVRFKARGITGQIFLDAEGASRGIGQLDFAHGVDLAPGARTPLTVDLTFTYGELKDAWGSLRAVVLNTRPGTWRLDGQVSMEAMGIPITVPLRSRKTVNQ